ncbi:MAG: class I tRNA ligase family protein, partial [bacterium]
RWILHGVSRLAGEVTRALEDYRFDVAADRLYHFVWHEYADWYIELVKSHLEAEGVERDRAIAVLLTVHDQVLRLLHPFMPFVTEELWQTLPQRLGEGLTPDGQARTITRAAYPAEQPAWRDDAAVTVLELLQEVTTTVRTVRAELGVPPSRKLTLVIEGAGAADREVLEAHAEYLRRLARLESFGFAASVERDPDTVRRVVGDMRLHLPLAGIVDRSAETARAERELGKLAKQLASLNGKLGNPKFRERAAPAVVAEAEAQLEVAQRRREQLERMLAELTT